VDGKLAAVPFSRSGVQVRDVTVTAAVWGYVCEAVSRRGTRQKGVALAVFPWRRRPGNVLVPVAGRADCMQSSGLATTVLRVCAVWLALSFGWNGALVRRPDVGAAGELAAVAATGFGSGTERQGVVTDKVPCNARSIRNKHMHVSCLI